MGSISHWQLLHTYSWGSAPPYNNWSEDFNIDVAAATKALQLGDFGIDIGPSNLNFINDIQSAYNVLSTTPSETHTNLWVTLSCKTEAGYLEDLAFQYYDINGD